jgi:hypothetical protein
VSEGNRNKQWAWRSLRTEAHKGDKGPSAFASALAGGFDEGERAVYVSSMLRYPYGPYMLATTARLGATNFPAADDAERLRRLGDNFQIRKYPTQTGEQYEQMLGLAWELHEEGGTLQGMRKALEAYGFGDIVIAEECYYATLGPDAEYHWSYVIVVGPNFGTVNVAGMYLGTWVLGSTESSHLGTGTFTYEQAEDLVRIILDRRQVHDCPIRLIFRFGNAPLLGLINLGSFYLGGTVPSGIAVFEIQGRRMLGSWYLGTSTLEGFGVTHGN